MSGETKQRISELEAEIARLREAQPTLRDQFAMSALTGVIAMGPGEGKPKDYAHAAYVCADAMMEARDDK